METWNILKPYDIMNMISFICINTCEKKKKNADILIVSLYPLDRFTSSIMDCTKGRRGVTGVSVGAAEDVAAGAGVASGRFPVRRQARRRWDVLAVTMHIYI